MPVQSHIQLRRQKREQATWARLAFAFAALVFTDGIFGNSRHACLVCGLYLTIVLGLERLMRGRWALDRRRLAMGAVDIGFLTGVVFFLGPASSVLPFVYLLIPILHASTSARSQVAMRLAVLSALSYASILVAVGSGLLPYAPVHGGRLALPHASILVSSGTLVGGSVLITTSLVLRQLRALDRMNERLSELSQLDELTGLYNRRFLTAELRRQLERVARGRSLGVMMIDLDNFKRINDELGHDAGDLVLVEVGAALGAEMRSIDLVARYGGDEFVVLLPDLEEESALAVAERVVASIAQVTRRRWPDLPVTASVGLTMARPGDELSTVLKRADEHAYSAKRAGGDRASLCASAPSAVAPRPTAPAELRNRSA